MLPIFTNSDIYIPVNYSYYYVKVVQITAILFYSELFGFSQ